MASVELSYYYGYEAEQFSFYRIPKLLFTDSRFAGISTDPAHTSFTEYAEAMKCFETHVTMLYALHRHLRRETHKQKGATGRER